MRPLIRLVSLACAGATGVVLAGLVGVAPAAADPPGSNGTIKIDGVEFGSHPDNEPHVGCLFEVDFYGFDMGDIVAEVTFQAQAPTVASDRSPTLLTDRVFVGEDDNSGGGSEAGLDASASYELDFTGITPHPVQGYHVQATISTPGKKGLDTKHKTFWTSGCDEEEPPINY